MARVRGVERRFFGCYHTHMEGYGRTKRKLHLTSFYKSGVLSLGALLFCISQVLRFIQLFRDAAARKAANQAPPENYTAAGITWAALLIIVIAGICFLLLRNRNNRLRMPRRRAHMLLSALVSLWGLYYFVSLTVEMIRNSELTLLFDIAAIAAGVIAPVVLLQLWDITGDLADDVALMICGIGGMALSAISLVVLIILRQGYANAQLLLVTEFMFRIALVLVSLAALIKAIQLRNSYPITQELPAQRPEPERERERTPARRKRAEDEPFTLHLDGVQESFPKHAERAKAQARQHVDSLLQYASQDFDDEEPAGAAKRERERVGTSRAMQAASWDTGRIIVQGGTGRISTQDPGMVPSERQTCPYCGKRMPMGFPNCPRCGRDM